MIIEYPLLAQVLYCSWWLPVWTLLYDLIPIIHDSYSLYPVLVQFLQTKKIYTVKCIYSPTGAMRWSFPIHPSVKIIKKKKPKANMEEKDNECRTLRPKHAWGTYFKYLVGAMWSTRVGPQSKTFGRGSFPISREVDSIDRKQGSNPASTCICSLCHPWNFVSYSSAGTKHLVPER